MKSLFLLIGVIVFASLVARAQSDIRGMDFKNFTYQPSCTDMEDGKKLENITVKKGEFERSKEMDGYTDHFYFEIRGIEYGDVNGDGKDEAIIVSNCNTGGTGQFTEGFIYTLKAGKPVLLTRIPGGDRADGGLVKAWAENGILFVKANDADSNSGACCPEYTVTYKYRVTGGKLTEAGKGPREEIYKRERLAFDRGMSGKTFKIKLESNDRRRYIVGAGAGQTLFVSTDVEGVDPGLLGDTDSTPGKNSFTAKLPKKGDYTFEIANNTEVTKEITVTVTIK